MSRENGAPPSAALTFHELSFTVKDRKSKKPKLLLDAVSGTAEPGHTLAILGPSGAGKTTLMNVLTLRASGGDASGSTRLGGKPLTHSLFRKTCFTVGQRDELWPTLTPREQLCFARRLAVAAGAEVEEGRVDEILKRMGLESCADTRVGHEMLPGGGLSGGQKRRLSLALALLKRAICMFLDEPTSGLDTRRLDAAAALNTMTFIGELAKQERLIAVCTIHQPSTAIYLAFDGVMLLSEGRVAYRGAAAAAVDYFASRGRKMPELTNPADFLLDLVNADFADKSEVDELLDAWADSREKRDSESDLAALGAEADLDGDGARPNVANQLAPLLRRQALLLLSRDPLVLFARALCFMLGNAYFAVVYIKTRERHQDQVLNKMWLHVWFTAVPSQITCLLVFALNFEGRLVRTEVQNGLVSPAAYLVARSVLELPLASRFATTVLCWMAQQYCWDAFATALAVAFDNPLIGAAQYIGCWFSAFLYGGFLIPVKDIVWPLRALHWIFPLGYAIRSITFSEFVDGTWDACDKYDEGSDFCYCQGEDPSKSCSGRVVLDSLEIIYPLFSSKNTILLDVICCLALAVGAKLFACVAFVKSTQGSPPPKAAAAAAPEKA
ncbi:ATPase [Aureococcus anophagefferens]|nr:ATPase [Aureococcus anophagefferens]